MRTSRWGQVISLKRDELSGGFSGFSAMAIGAADQECEVLRALIEVALQELAKSLRW